MRETHEDVLLQKALPRVGQIVRSRKDGSLWRIMEKREVWQPLPDDPATSEPRITPAINLTYWRIQPGVVPGVGEMIGCVHTLRDNTFESNWEIVKE
jgi:hypothetical protein